MSVIAAILTGATLAAGCTGTDSVAGPDPTSQFTDSVASEALISVTVSLPQGGHSDAVDGTVADEQGRVVATFRIDPDFIFLEDSSAANIYGPSTSLQPDGTNAVVELPGPGTYTFSIDGVFYWGGCGTCGAIYDGGTVKLSVEEGSAVTLDLGIRSGAT